MKAVLVVVLFLVVAVPLTVSGFSDRKVIEEYRPYEPVREKVIIKEKPVIEKEKIIIKEGPGHRPHEKVIIKEHPKPHPPPPHPHHSHK